MAFNTQKGFVLTGLAFTVSLSDLWILGDF